MGIPTLISTATASDAASVDITSGIDSTYDEYMFVCTDIGPATDGQNFTMQFNVASASGFNETITSTFFRAYHDEADSATALQYEASRDQAQGTAYQPLTSTAGNGADESCAGIVHLFSPSNTTYVTHFYSRFTMNSADSEAFDEYCAGYVNATAAVDEISFKFASGNMDGVIQMYGIA
jgi:hypothetical protein